MTSNSAECLYLSSYAMVMVPVTEPNAIARDPDRQGVMGKAPGVLRNGKAVTIDLRGVFCKSLAEAKLWDSWHWNVGLACGRDLGDGTGLVALDGDIDDAAVSKAIMRDFAELFELTGDLCPIRGVKAQGYFRFLIVARMLLTELPGGFRDSYVHPDGRVAAVDGLWTNKQFVAAGTHKSTLAPFFWSPGLPPGGPKGIPFWSPATLDAARKTIDRHLVAAGYRSTASTATGLLLPSGARSVITASEAEVRALVALMPNADTDHAFDARERWIGVGHALHSASEGAQWGLDIWHEWNGQRAQTEDPAALWEQFDKNPPKTAGFASLTQYAAQASGSAKAAAVLIPDAVLPPDEAAALAKQDAKALHDEAAQWRSITKHWAYVVSERGFANLSEPAAALLSHADMAHKFGPILPELRRHLINRKTYGAKAKPSFSECFWHAPGAIIVEQRVSYPGQPLIFTPPNRANMPWLNTWKAPDFGAGAVPKARVRSWLEFARYVCGSSWAAEMLRAWFALLLQDWSTRASWAILLRTKPGVGKNLLIQPLLDALGPDHVAQPEMAALFGRFKTHLLKRLVLVSETHALHGHGRTGQHDMNALKEQIAGAQMVSVERKGLPIIEVPALSQTLMLANDDDALTMAGDDRRFCVMANDADPRSPAFYAEMARWNADRDNVMALARYHCQLRLPQEVRDLLQGPAPKTDARQALIDATADPVAAALAELIEDARQAGDARMVQTPAQLVAALLESRALSAQEKRAIKTGTRLNAMLLALGAKPVRPAPNGRSAEPVNVPGTSTKGRYWLMASTDAQGRYWAGLSEAELAAASRDGWPRKPGAKASVTELPPRQSSTPTDPDPTSTETDDMV